MMCDMKSKVLAKKDCDQIVKSIFQYLKMCKMHLLTFTHLYIYLFAAQTHQQASIKA